MPNAVEQVTIRLAHRDEIPGIMVCLARAFEPYREDYTADAFRDTTLTHDEAERRLREMTVLVAVDKTARVVGTISYYIRTTGEGHLRGMAVLPEFQRQGVAQRLLVAAETGLRSSACSRVTLDVTRCLQRATRFYSKHGYKATGVVKDYFGMCLFEYEKMLKQPDNPSG